MNTIQRQRISHEVVVDLDPSVEFSGIGSVVGTVSGHGVFLVWKWNEKTAAWETSSPGVKYHRIKKDGALYEHPQNTRLWHDNLGPFAEIIEATRPQYIPEAVTL